MKAASQPTPIAFNLYPIESSEAVEKEEGERQSENREQQHEVSAVQGGQNPV